MDEHIVRIAREVLATGRKILVVGVMPGNMGKWHNLENSQLIFWDSREEGRHVSVPESTGLVLMTRFCRHHFYAKIRNSLPSGATFPNQLFHTGELKKLLGVVFPASKKVPAKILPPVRVVDLKPEEKTPSTEEVSMVKEETVKIMTIDQAVEAVRLIASGLSAENGDLHKQIAVLQEANTFLLLQVEDLQTSEKKLSALSHALEALGFKNK